MQDCVFVGLGAPFTKSTFKGTGLPGFHIGHLLSLLKHWQEQHKEEEKTKSISAASYGTMPYDNVILLILEYIFPR